MPDNPRDRLATAVKALDDVTPGPFTDDDIRKRFGAWSAEVIIAARALLAAPDDAAERLATLTRERDDARAVLKALGFEGERLALAHEAVAAGLTVETHEVDNDEHYLDGVPLPVPGEWFGVSDGALIRIFTERMWEPADGGDNDHYSFVNGAEFDDDTGKQTPNGLAYIERNKKKTWYETGSDAIAAYNAARGGKDE